MYVGITLIAIGIALQVFAWRRYRRNYPEFWVSRPIWYFLYPKGVALFIAGVWIVLGGVAVYVKA